MTEPNGIPLKPLNVVSVRRRFRGNSLAPAASPVFVRRKGAYVAAPWQRYENSLLAAVGFLELFNALDFPANVWNNYPIPTFVKLLMGFGGSIAIFGSCTAFWDMHLCKRNVAFLRDERNYLKNWRRHLENTNHLKSARLVDACLDVNFRELGWEVCDRFLMDAFMGVGGILVGAGTLMAIRGDIPEVYRVSNLLSGYVGNSFGAVYVFINATWSVYMWRRARMHSEKISSVDAQIEPLVRRRVRSHSRRHQLYAFVNGLAVFVAGIGGLMSATMWEGYVVLIPCIICSVFANFFWRHKLGYNRDSVQTWIDIHDFNVLTRLESVITMHDVLAGKSPTSAESLQKITQWTSNPEVLEYLQENGLYVDFCANLLKDPVSAKQVLGKLDERVVIDQQKILSADRDLLANTARACIRGVGRVRFRDTERFLLELLGCYLCAKAPQGRPMGAKDWEYCLSPVLDLGHRAEWSSDSSER